MARLVFPLQPWSIRQSFHTQEGYQAKTLHRHLFLLLHQINNMNRNITALILIVLAIGAGEARFGAHQLQQRRHAAFENARRSAQDLEALVGR